MNEGAIVSKVGLIFLEEFQKNFYIELTKEDNEIIKNKIFDTYKNIKSLNFEPAEDEKACQYCTYKQLCKLNVI